MTKEERDKMLNYLAEQINNDITECRIRIAKETGRIEGLQMAAEQIGRYIEGRAESEGEE